MVKKDFFWPGGPCFYYDTDLFPPGTDSFALGYFARPSHGDTVCDLGSGTGLLGALLLLRDATLTVENVELNADADALARRTFSENGWGGQARFRVGDLRESSVLPPPGSVDLVVSNPPYFPQGSGASAPNGARRTAREECSCTLADVCAAAGRVLRWGGRFALVHRAERMTDVLCAMRASGIEPKRLRFLSRAADAAPSLLLVEGKRGGKSGLAVAPPLVPGSEEWDAVYFRAR